MPDQKTKSPIWTTENQKKLDELEGQTWEGGAGLGVGFGFWVAAFVIGVAGGPVGLVLGLLGAGALFVSIDSILMYREDKNSKELTELRTRKTDFDNFNKLSHKPVLSEPEATHSFSKDSVSNLEQPDKTEQNTLEPVDPSLASFKEKLAHFKKLDAQKGKIPKKGR